MAYRTKTYIAADWDGDKNAIDQLHTWNDGKKWSLSFTDAHDLTQARDNSLNCSIKASLAKYSPSSNPYEENTILKTWYAANGFVHTGTKKFKHLPFTTGYMEWEAAK